MTKWTHVSSTAKEMEEERGNTSHATATLLPLRWLQRKGNEDEPLAGATPKYLPETEAMEKK
jgi:hypothetical protein